MSRDSRTLRRKKKAPASKAGAFIRKILSTRASRSSFESSSFSLICIYRRNSLPSCRYSSCLCSKTLCRPSCKPLHLYPRSTTSHPCRCSTKPFPSPQCLAPNDAHSTLERPLHQTTPSCRNRSILLSPVHSAPVSKGKSGLRFVPMQQSSGQVRVQVRVQVLCVS